MRLPELVPLVGRKGAHLQDGMGRLINTFHKSSGLRTLQLTRSDNRYGLVR